jgi:hypothetical protein
MGPSMQVGEAAQAELCQLKQHQAVAPGSAPPAELLERAKELHMHSTSWAPTSTALQGENDMVKLTNSP